MDASPFPTLTLPESSSTSRPPSSLYGAADIIVGYAQFPCVDVAPQREITPVNDMLGYRWTAFRFFPSDCREIEQAETETFNVNLVGIENLSPVALLLVFSPFHPKDALDICSVVFFTGFQSQVETDVFQMGGAYPDAASFHQAPQGKSGRYASCLENGVQLGVAFFQEGLLVQNQYIL